MTAAAERPPLVKEVLSGRNRDLQFLAAKGILPLPPEELIALQVELTTLGDAEVADAARESLASVDPLSIRQWVGSEAPIEVVEFLGRTSSAPTLLEPILQRRDLTGELAAEFAPHLSAEMQEIFLLRQDLIVEYPQILEALEKNPRLTGFSARRIAEYRRHLIDTDEDEEEAEAEAAEAPGKVAEGEVDDDEEAALLAEAIEEVMESVEPEGELDPGTGLTEAQIKSLPPPMRTKLARGASRSLRTILLRDTNPQVAVAVLSSSAVTESEIEQLTNSRAVVEEVLGAISRNREWMRKYTIVHNLVKNPRTPVGVAVRCASRLSVRDLSMAAKDRNVSDAVRQTCRRLLAAKKN